MTIKMKCLSSAYLMDGFLYDGRALCSGGSEILPVDMKETGILCVVKPFIFQSLSEKRQAKGFITSFSLKRYGFLEIKLQAVT